MDQGGHDAIKQKFKGLENQSVNKGLSDSQPAYKDLSERQSVDE